MPEFRRIRIANPAKRRRNKTVLRAKVQRRASRPSRRRKKNPGLGGGVLTLMSNPRKKKSLRRKNPFVKAAKVVRRRRKNPAYSARKRNGGRRKNPFQVAGMNTTGILKLALGAGAGAVGTRSITQIILKEKNENIAGYVGNITVALLLAYAGGKALGVEVGSGVLAGGLAATVQRLWDEKVSKVLPAAVAAATGMTPATVKGLGDVSYSDDGLGRMGALGQYVNASFPLSTESGPYVATPPALPAGAMAASGTVALPGASKPVYQAAW